MSSPAESLDRPSQITASHLEKLALVYVRQSTAEQVRSNTGSTEEQRGLVSLPKRWGWPESRIELIEDDLGQPGTSIARRSGFQSMLNLIRQGRVGLIVVRDMSRLSRNVLLSETLLHEVIQARVLVSANGHILDPASGQLGDTLNIRIQNMFAWLDNQVRSRNMIGAKEARVRQGYAVAGRPIGYVSLARGTWIKDPDSAVRDTIQRVFDLALESHSIGRILRYMEERQLQLPKRVHGGIVWVRPARSTVAKMLANPNYTPDYFYRRHRARSSATGRSQTMEIRPTEEWLVSRDHHDGYISRDQWERLQTALKSRRPRVQPPIRNGAALLQGKMWCRQCEHRMWTSYHRRRGDVRLPSYLCRQGHRLSGAAHHVVRAAERVDELVVAHVLAVLETVDPTSALTVIEQARAEQLAVREHQSRLLKRANADVDAAWQRYTEVGSEHARVKADLLGRYEQAIQRRDALQDQGHAHRVDDVLLTAKDAEELTALTQQLESLWSAPTTTNEDRKQILGLVLERVIVVTSTSAELEVELVWVSGLRERLRRDYRAELDARVRDLRIDGKAPRRIVSELQAVGVPSTTGKKASADIVRRSLERNGLNRAAERQRILKRVHESLLEGRPRGEILTMLDVEFPRPGRRWHHGDLYRVIRRLQEAPQPGRRGVADIPALPPGLLDKPDTTTPIALTEQWRKEGKTWSQCAADLNAMGLRPPRADKFTVFQLMEMVRRARGADPGAQ